MLIAFDVGNTHIHCGVFKQDKLITQFRYSTTLVSATSDQIGIFLKQVLRENDINPKKIKYAGISSVVPSINYTLSSAIIKYFSIKPFFINHKTKSNLKIKYPFPHEVGADMIAGAIYCIEKFPNKNIIMIDMGTATTINPINKNKEFLGGVILTGIKSSVEALSQKASQLPMVSIKKLDSAIGLSTEHCIQSGLYFGTIGAMKEIFHNIKKELNWEENETITIATGGFSNVFINSNIFDYVISDLLLQGINLSFKKS